MDNWFNLEWLGTGSSEHQTAKGIKEATENTGKWLSVQIRLRKVNMKRKKGWKFGRGQEAMITVWWNKRLTVVGEVEEEVNVTIEENFAWNVSEISENTYRTKYSTIDNVVKSGKHTLSSIAYQSANGRPWGASQNFKYIYPSPIPLLGDIPTYVKKRNKEKCARLFTAALLIMIKIHKWYKYPMGGGD